MKLSSVNRIEVIDEKGRGYTKYNVQNVELQLQDNERTLKVFVSSAPDFDIESLDPSERSWYYDDTGVKRKKDN